MAKMSSFKEDNNTHSLLKKLLPWTLYALVPVVLIRFYLYPLSLPQAQAPQDVQSRRVENVVPCDYAFGKWVPSASEPLYNASSCSTTVKYGRNCVAHGRLDLEYLHWKWEPNGCPLPRFAPYEFLQLLRNKHLVFVGDSLARNQLESLLCMLSTVSKPDLVYNEGKDDKFRRWHFKSHNFTVSNYWSPFLVKGIEKSVNDTRNKLFLDSVDERWAGNLSNVDMVVLSIGHWYLHSALYYDGDSILGCHSCSDLNYTSEIGFYGVFGKAIRTTLRSINERKKGIDVIVTTFSPAHFEGEWDKLGACPKTRPYNVSEKSLEGMDAEMRKAEVEEIEKAKREFIGGMRLEALDVTELALMRPDAHPGPYMNPFPFANGIPERVQNDCVHWCLPGAIDTWNEILLQIMKRWANVSKFK